MEEAYKILPEDQHPHWDKFKEFHREATVNYISSILGDAVSKDEFVKVYCNLSGSKRPPANAKNLYKHLIKHKWIKPIS